MNQKHRNNEFRSNRTRITIDFKSAGQRYRQTKKDRGKPVGNFKCRIWKIKIDKDEHESNVENIQKVRQKQFNLIF